MLRCLTADLARHSPGMLPTASAGWNRHQLAANVSVPADIRGGDEVAEETPSVLRVYPERQFEPTIAVGTGVHPFGYVPILRCVSPTEPI